MQTCEFVLNADDGTRLYARSWEPLAEAVGVIGIVHGLGEHAGRYDNVAQRLAAAGYIVLAFDQRGHGRTKGQRGYVRDYTVLLDDVATMVTEAYRRSNGRPVFAYGHSLGGNLVLNYALRRRPNLAGLVVTSPLFRPAAPVPVWKLLLGRVLGRVWPRFPLDNGVDPKAISHDEAVVQAYRDDALVHGRVTARLGAQMLEAGEWAMRHAHQMQHKLLLIHGAADALASPEASIEFARGAGEKCLLRIWEGLYHETHWERERDLVIQYVVDWLRNTAHQAVRQDC